MNRHQRRSINKDAKKKYKNILIRKGRLEDKLKSIGVPDGLEPVHEYKKFWIGSRFIKGPKIAPTTTWRFKNIMIRYNIENLFIGAFGYVLKIKDWTVRNNKKPSNAFYKWVFRLNKGSR